MTTYAMSHNTLTRCSVYIGAMAAAFAVSTVAVRGQTGERLYATRCASCHGSIGQGSNIAPSLIGTPPVKVHFMLDTGRMPASAPGVQQTHQAQALDEFQIDAVTAYVAGFSQHADLQLPLVIPGDAARGRELYAENCEQCHGAGATGGAVGPGEFRVAPTLMQATVFQVAEAVRSGPGIMPAFGPGVLSDRDVNDIARYVNVLQTQPRNPGQISLANVGPSAEGLVAWIFGIGALIGLARLLGSGR